MTRCSQAREREVIKMAQWIQAAAKKMKKKGTLGSFGKATSKKIAAGRKKGGKMAKKANFAAMMKRFASEHPSGFRRK
jgi:hypothetical protein